MVVEMLGVTFSKEEKSLHCPLHCLVSWEGEFIIPRNQVFGKSRNQLVLDRLRVDKKKKKKRQKKVVQDGEGGDKKSTEDASDGESRKSPPEVTGDGDDHSC